MKINRFLNTPLLITVAILFVVFFCGCDKPEPKQTGAAKPAVTTNNNSPKPSGDQIIVGIDENFPPMAFRDKKGNLLGFEIELAKEVSKRMKRKLVFKPIDFALKEEELNSNKIDMVWSGLHITEERKEKFSFSKPYMKNQHIIIVSADSPIVTKDDLGGKITGAQAGSQALENLKAFKGAFGPVAKTKEYTEGSLILVGILKGEIDAALLETTQGRYYASRSPGKFRILDDFVDEAELGVMMRKNDGALVSSLNQALESMEADGTAQTIYKRWFGNNN